MAPVDLPRFSLLIGPPERTVPARGTESTRSEHAAEPLHRCSARDAVGRSTMTEHEPPDAERQHPDSARPGRPTYWTATRIVDELVAFREDHRHPYWPSSTWRPALASRARAVFGSWDAAMEAAQARYWERHPEAVEELASLMKRCLGAMVEWHAGVRSAPDAHRAASAAIDRAFGSLPPSKRVAPPGLNAVLGTRRRRPS